MKQSKVFGRLKTLITRISADGQGGLSVLGPRSVRLPAKGRVKYIGQIDGLETYRFTRDKDGRWILVLGDVEPIGGAEVITRIDLQDGTYATLIAADDDARIRQWSERRQESYVSVYHNGYRAARSIPWHSPMNER